jgi:hypothetical protein
LHNTIPLEAPVFDEREISNLTAPAIQTIGRIERPQGFIHGIDSGREPGMARNAAADLEERFAADSFRDLPESV